MEIWFKPHKLFVPRGISKNEFVNYYLIKSSPRASMKLKTIREDK